MEMILCIKLFILFLWLSLREGCEYAIILNVLKKFLLGSIRNDSY